MKILYFGTVLSSTEYENLLTDAKVKPSVAPFVFESALMDGFCKKGADVEVFSFPSLPSFPTSPRLRVKKNSSVLDCGYKCTTLPSSNIPGLKQLGRQINSRRMLGKWLKNNADSQKAVLIYSIYQPIAKSIISLCKKNKHPLFCNSARPAKTHSE